MAQTSVKAHIIGVPNGAERLRGLLDPLSINHQFTGYDVKYHKVIPTRIRYQ